MPTDPAIIVRRHVATVHRVACRYLNADLLHNPSDMPNIGDRVLRIEMDGSGVIEVLFENGETFHLVTGIHWEALDSDTLDWQERRLQELTQKSDRLAGLYLERKRADRLAARYLHREAGAGEWLQWFVQPAEIIWKHHKDFVQGPVDDAVDAIIKELAPVLVKAIGEQEVDADVDEFLEGAVQGKWDAEKGHFSASPRGTEDFKEGYAWGYANPSRVTQGDLPNDVKRRVVQEALKDYRKRITEEVVKRVFGQAWHAVSPVQTFKAIMHAVKTHGWKVGVAAALFEIFEHALLPTVMIALTGDEHFAILGTLPLGEILYAVVLRIIGSVPSEAAKLDADGHLDWYEDKYGPVRIAFGS